MDFYGGFDTKSAAFGHEFFSQADDHEGWRVVGSKLNIDVMGAGRFLLAQQRRELRRLARSEVAHPNQAKLIAKPGVFVSQLSREAIEAGILDRAQLSFERPFFRFR